MNGKGYTIEGKLKPPRLAETDPNDPLRLNDLMRFLLSAKRKTQCPHCDHRGPWEISLNESVDDYDPENPPLTMYRNYIQDGTFHTSAGMNCPQCGHFAVVSTYKIRAFLDRLEQGDEIDG